MRRRIFLMPDHSSSSVWDADGGEMIPLDDLPLSEPTKRRLEAWSDYDFLDEEAAPEPGDAAAREAEGRGLWQLVRTELGDEWHVGYAISDPDPDDALGALRRILWN